MTHNRDEIIKFINRHLEIDKCKDFALNGLQIEGKEEVSKIAFGVSASSEFIRQAIGAGADMVIVHHGLFWGRDVPIKGYLRERVNLLLSRNLTLLAYHLPLDKDPYIGNSAQLLNLFDIGHLFSNMEPFGKYNGSCIGFKGVLKKGLELDEIEDLLFDKLGSKTSCLHFGNDTIYSIAVVSGRAPEMIHQAIDEGVDLFITGETTEYIQEIAKESHINFISAGHYNTEKLGVQALAKLLEQEFFGLKTQFIDVPNNI